MNNILKAGAQELGIALSDRQIEDFQVYLSELEKWNRKINLTAISGEREIVIKHFLDSLAFAKGFGALPEPDLLDIGSGAGFPALPLKIAFPGLSVALAESVKKKASFLRHIVRTLKMTETEVYDRRSDELPAALLGTLDIVTARAFAAMGTAVREGGRFLKPGGRMVLSRGPEETIAEEDVTRAGMSIESKLDLVLPHSDHRRAIWVFRKEG